MSETRAKRIILARACRQEIVEAANYYRERGGDDLAGRCAHDLLLTVRKIAASPLAGIPLYGASVELRKRKAGKFPYNLCYIFNERDGTLYIYILLHQKQRPYTAEELRRIAEQRRDEVEELTFWQQDADVDEC